MKLMSKILELEKSIKDIGVKIANASKRRDPSLTELETKKASMETNLEKIIKQSNFGEGTDFTDSKIPGQVDYDADANNDTGAPMEDEPGDSDDGLDNFEEAAPVDADHADESSGSVSEEIMNSIADILEDKASEGLSVEDLVEALRSGDSGAEEDFNIDEAPDETEFTDEEDDMDFDDGEDNMDEMPEMGGSPEQLPSTDDSKFKFASLKCNKCGSTSFIKKNNKFACQHCKELISDLTGLPIDVLELISPKLREEAAMENGNMSMDEDVAPEGMGDDVVGIEIDAEPIEELGEDEFGDEEFEDSSELPDGEPEQEIEEDFEEEPEIEGSEESEGDELLEEHEESESPEEEMQEEESGDDEESEKKDLLEEHEEDESENEESEEHEKPDFMSKEAEIVYKAKLVKKSNKDQTYWLVFGNNTPLFKVSASYAWKDVDAVPKANEFPVKFASYYDAFTSVLYRDSIIKHCVSAGYKTCCNLANGRMLKSAQTFGNNPLQGNGAVGENPVPNTNNNNAPGGLGADTLNPDANTEAMFNENEPAKILITDIIVNWLAPEIANGTYNLEEIMTELKATFSDEAAISEFEGQLREKADNFSDKKDDEPLGAEPESPMGDLGLGGGAPMAPAGQDVPPTGGAADLSSPIRQASKKVSAKKPCCDTCKKEPCTCKEDEANAKLAEKNKEIALRFKVAAAKKYIETEMQTRGFSGQPLIETVDFLVSQGTDQVEAEQLVKNAVNTQIKTIVKMSDEEFANYTELVEKSPKLAAREEKEAFEKFASVMENDSTALPYMPNKELKSGVDAILDDDLFNNSRISELADAHARNRRNTKYIG